MTSSERQVRGELWFGEARLPFAVTLKLLAVLFFRWALGPSVAGGEINRARLEGPARAVFENLSPSPETKERRAIAVPPKAGALSWLGQGFVLCKLPGHGAS